MSLPKRDVIATVLVGVAVALYWLWSADSAPAGLESVRATGLAVLGLGFAASASAVVPGFEQLLHGNKLYLVVTAIIGLAALAAGMVMLVSSSEIGLAMLMAAMVVLWLVATIHHCALAAATGESGWGQQRQRPRPA